MRGQVEGKLAVHDLPSGEGVNIIVKFVRIIDQG